jgi:hypothetical protein
MRILVDHLTRMQWPHICVAGVAVETGRWVRPLPPPPSRLTVDHSASRRGPFGLGMFVDIGVAVPIRQAPEVEDHRFDTAGARSLGSASPATFWRHLSRHAEDRLTTVFGGDLQRHGGTCAVDVGRGSRSLGVMRPAGGVVLRMWTGNRSGVKVEFEDPELGDLSVSLTDLRCFDAEGAREDVVRWLTSEAHTTGALLSVGLSRPWHRPQDATERHWLQVNNIHLENAPLWSVQASPASPG